MTRRLVNVMDAVKSDVTFAITLPACAPLDDYVAALLVERDRMRQVGSPDAAMALHCVYTLAVAGLFYVKSLNAEPLSDTHQREGK